MRIQHDLVPGSDEWHAFRLEHFGASEAAAMLGLSKHVKRNELLRAKHTGVAKEFSDWVQTNILDNGHRVEEMARPIAISIIGDDLYRGVYSDGKPSASCDGLTMDDTTAWEHKQWNEQLAESVRNNVLPEEHEPQCQQVLWITRASRLLFMVSDGTPDKCVYMWVLPDKAWFRRLQLGWDQFAEDLANYVHKPSAPEAVAEHIDALPALAVRIEGRVLQTNMDQFSQNARAYIAKINVELKTDDDFATAEKNIGFCKEAEDRLGMVKEQALSQMVEIDEVFRMIDGIREELRAKRLALDKLVTKRKADIRYEIQDEAKAALVAYVADKNLLLGKPYMPAIASDFAGVMKSKRTVASLRDAADTELARCKIVANDYADRIMANLNSLRELADGFQFLFSDTAQIVLKQNDDLVALVKLRISEHKEAEAKRVERERVAREVEARILEAAKPVVEKAAVAMAAGDAVVIDASNVQEPVRVVPSELMMGSAQGAVTATEARGTGRTPDAGMPWSDEQLAAPGSRGQGPRVDNKLDDIMVNMHIANITRGQAKTIAEYLGGGAVVWQGGMCYPTGDCACTIVLADGKDSAERVVRG